MSYCCLQTGAKRYTYLYNHFFRFLQRLSNAKYDHWFCGVHLPLMNDWSLQCNTKKVNFRTFLGSAQLRPRWQRIDLLLRMFKGCRTVGSWRTAQASVQAVIAQNNGWLWCWALTIKGCVRVVNLSWRLLPFVHLSAAGCWCTTKVLHWPR